MNVTKTNDKNIILDVGGQILEDLGPLQVKKIIII